MDLAIHLSPIDIQENPLTKHYLIDDYLKVVLRRISGFDLIIKPGKRRESYELGKKLSFIISEEANTLETENLRTNLDVSEAKNLKDVFITIARLEVTKRRILANIESKNWDSIEKEKFVNSNYVYWVQEENEKESYYLKNGTYSWAYTDFEEWLPSSIENYERFLKSHRTPKSVEKPKQVERNFDFFSPSKPPSIKDFSDRRQSVKSSQRQHPEYRQKDTRDREEYSNQPERYRFPNISSPVTSSDGWSVQGQRKGTQQSRLRENQGYNSGRGFSGRGSGMNRGNSNYGKYW